MRCGARAFMSPFRLVARERRRPRNAAAFVTERRHPVRKGKGLFTDLRTPPMPMRTNRASASCRRSHAPTARSFTPKLVSNWYRPTGTGTQFKRWITNARGTKSSIRWRLAHPEYRYALETSGERMLLSEALAALVPQCVGAYPDARLDAALPQRSGAAPA